MTAQLHPKVRRIPSSQPLISDASRTADDAASTSGHDPPPRLFSLLTYNVLADCYVRVPGQPWNAFEHCSEAALAQSNRLPRIQQELLSSRADVICLQELEFEKQLGDDGQERWCLPAWTSALTGAGYTGVMQGLPHKELCKNAERNARTVGRAVPTGLATFYLTSRWEEAAPSKHGSGSGSVLYLRAPGDPSQRIIAVANVHLVGDPAKSGTQLKQLDSCLRNLTALGPDWPRIIAGDFNSELLPGAGVAEWVAGAQLQQLPLEGSSWAGPGQGLQLDHVVFSAQHLGVEAVTQALGEEDVREGLPNMRRPSDHIAIGGVFRFK